MLTDSAGKPVAAATVSLHPASGVGHYKATTSPDGKFAFAAMAAGSYKLSVKLAGQEWKGIAPPRD